MVGIASGRSQFAAMIFRGSFYDQKIAVRPPIFTFSRASIPMKFFVLPIVFALTILATGVSALAQNELFPFVISFDAPKNATNIAAELPRPAGKDGFVRVENGHFATDAGRIQFWGTNLCFGANFVDKDTADRLADRLARFGINCVRLHHLDMRDIWGKNFDRTMMQFDPEQLDRLDYLVSTLKTRGIYVNINLHVSRSLDERDGFPKNVNRPSHDKGIDNYYRPFIDANKKYARDLLEHVNPYTKTAYKDEPAVAMVEINNENSILCMWGGWGGLDKIEDPFLGVLQREWNDWLKAKYEDDAGLRKAWKARSEKPGMELLRNGDFPKGYTPAWDGWSWETNKNTDAPATNADGILKLDVRKKGDVQWHPQLVANGFTVKGDKLYTLTVKARADKAVSLNLGVRENHDPWGGLGFDTKIDLTPEWKIFQFTVSPEKNDGNTRVSIGGFQEGIVYEIDSVSFRQGGEIGLPRETGTGEISSLTRTSVPVIWKKDANRFPKEAVDDFCDFLVDIEAKYWDEMRLYLKDEIKVRQPVSGTQLQYGSTHAQAKMDYCDIHAYWNHPSFPGRPWDGNNWYLHNRALVNHLDKDILPALATSRVYDKPFTVSEYNHPYPNQYAAEGLPILAAFGAFQNWDGIFPFAYCHSKNTEPQMAGSFFDTAGNTVQMAHMIACKKLFCDGYNKQADGKTVVAPMSVEKEREIFKDKKHVYAFDFSGLGLDRRIALTNPVAVDVSGEVSVTPKADVIPKDCKVFSTAGLRYDMQTPEKGWFNAHTGLTALFTGFVEEGKTYPLITDFGISITFGKTNLGWTTVSVAPIDEKRFLLVATGQMLNTDMKLETLDGDKITVGNRWGKAPVRCEGIPAVITQKGLSKEDSEVSIKVWILDESGNRKQEIPVKRSGDEKLELELKPEYKTIWYELEIMK